VAGGGWQRGNIMPSANFHFDGVHVFLTYPRCTLEREQLRDFILQLEPDAKYIVARELHDDGTPHLHAYAHFGKRRRFASERAFDLDGHHPNIQRPRNAKHVIAYCRKEDASPLVSDGLGDGVEPSGNGWGEILETATNKEEFLSLVRARYARDYVINLEKVLYAAEWMYGRDETEYSGRTRSEFREPATLTAWVRENLEQVHYITHFPPLRLPAPLHLFN